MSSHASSALNGSILVRRLWRCGEELRGVRVTPQDVPMVAAVPRPKRATVLLATAVAVNGCGGSDSGFERVEGAAMGTTYAVQAACPGGVPAQRLAAVLDRVDRAMSTYDETSELAMFNRAPVGVPVPVSPWLADVADAAQRVAEETGGAFDATVGPLVAFWGFGADAEALPDRTPLREARSVVGHGRLKVALSPPTLTKLAEVRVDFSAIAKGFAVDRMADVLDGASCRAYLVELGGELRAHGRAPDGGAWRVGVEAPLAFASGGLQTVLHIRDGALATSGGYRQFREPTKAEQALLPRGQTRVSHVVDPRSGLPVAHALASVTVVARSAVLADAYATALLVLGTEAGLAFAERRGIAALFVEDGEDGLQMHGTAAMGAYTTSGRLP